MVLSPGAWRLVSSTVLNSTSLATNAHCQISSHTYIHICIHTCILTYLPTYIHTYIHAYIHTCRHACIDIYIYIHTCAHAYVKSLEMQRLRFKSRPPVLQLRAPRRTTSTTSFTSTNTTTTTSTTTTRARPLVGAALLSCLGDLVSRPTTA